jgi:uncharacterized membrane protein YccC
MLEIPDASPVSAIGRAAGRMSRFRLPIAIFSLNSFLAALLALYIGFSLGLPRPYWAMLTVYITAQPLSGALRSKAVYRVLGTILGGVAAVVLVPNLVDAPWVLSLALSAWVGLCLYLSLLDRTPRAYVFMLAGYTAGIIGFPSVGEPGTIFETALARVEEITLGILCASFVHTIIFPRSVLAAINVRIAAIMTNVQGWAADLGSMGPEPGRPRPTSEQERDRIAADITELQLLATHLPFDTANLVPATRTIRGLEDRLALLLPLASAVEDRRDALIAIGGLSQNEIATMTEIRAWIVANPVDSRAEAVRLQQLCLAAQPILDGGSSWADFLKASLVGRLFDLVGALQDARDLALHIGAPHLPPPPSLLGRLAGNRARPLHRDHGLAALSGFAAFAAVCGCCVLWIATAWPDGAVAPMMAAVFASFFAAQDDPAPSIGNFLKFLVLSLPIAALYLFALLPAIDGFPMLAMTLAPALLVLGYLQGLPSTTGRAMPLIIGFLGALSLQAVYSADFTSFINSFLAQIVGTAGALVSTQLFRSVGADFSARRILRFGWREIADNAARPPGAVIPRDVWISTMLDRLGLLAPRLAAAERRDKLAEADLLNDLRIGINVIDLQLARGVVGAAAERSIVSLLADVADHFRGRALERPASPPPSLLTEIDRALGDVAGAWPSPERRVCLWSIAGLRRNLFPGASAYVAVGAAERAA